MIYFVQCGDNGPVKIGQSKNLKHRMKHLQWANPQKLHLIKELKGDSDYEIHNILHVHRIRGEWFEAHEDVLGFTQENLDNCEPEKTCDFRIHNIDDDLWQDFKTLCVREGVNPNDKIKQILMHYRVKAGKV